MSETDRQARFALAMKYRGEAAVLDAKADILKGKDASGNYERAAESFRMHAEAEVSSIRNALKNLGK